MSVFTHEFKDKEFAASCLTICARSNLAALLITMYDTAIAQGFGNVAQKLHITKEELHILVTPAYKRSLETIKTILQAMGFDLAITADKEILITPSVA